MWQHTLKNCDILEDKLYDLNPFPRNAYPEGKLKASEYFLANIVFEVANILRVQEVLIG